MICVLVSSFMSFGFSQLPPLEVQFRNDEKKVGKDCTVKIVTPFFASNNPLALLANQEIKPDFTKDRDEFVKNYLEYVRDPGVRPQAPWEMTVSPTVSLADSRLVSVVMEHYWYSGGAHPNTRSTMYNYGFVGNQATRLTLDKILNKGVSVEWFMNKVVLPDLNEIKRKRDMDELDGLDPVLAHNFYLSKGGITFLFSRYDVGAYVEGEYLVKLPWNRVDKYFDQNKTVNFLFTEPDRLRPTRPR